MPWSKAQHVFVHRAAQAAGWNDRQRYIAMRHCGCPDDPRTGRPSVKHRGNSQRAFELFMALAEAAARGRGAGRLVPRPANAIDWAERTLRDRDAYVRRVELVWSELAARIPEVFGVTGGLDGFVRRMTSRDDPVVTFDRRPERLGECDDSQLYRILEGLKKWGGRECLKRGITPESFDIPEHPIEPREGARRSRERRKAAREHALPI